MNCHESQSLVGRSMANRLQQIEAFWDRLLIQTTNRDKQQQIAHYQKYLAYLFIIHKRRTGSEHQLPFPSPSSGIIITIRNIYFKNQILLAS